MDSLTVVIQLTGLLMIVPPNPGTIGPTHVLMPEPEFPDRLNHVAVIGFRRNDSAQHCDENSGRDFCFVRMDGWALDPLPGRSSQVDLPHSVLDLTHGSGGRRVHRDHFGRNAPRDSLRSRMTFGGGGVTDTCQFGQWRFDPVGNSPAERLWLSNVVEWTIRDIPQTHLRLVRRRFGGGSEQPLVTLTPDRSGRIELLIAHVPRDAWGAFQRNLLNLAPMRQNQVSMPGGSPTATSANTDIAHFRSFYRLLDRARERRLPSNPDERDEGCPMMIWFPRELKIMAPTTVNCMVTSGTS
jgi:hypothetical protein